VDSAEVERVNFTEFGDYSLKFLVIYYINSPEQGKYLDTQQAINYAIKEAFERENIEIAFPTSAVYVKNSPNSKQFAETAERLLDAQLNA
jgi:small-conductance mechanosensitive channel